MDIGLILLICIFTYLFILHNNFSGKYKYLLFSLECIEKEIEILKKTKSSEELRFENRILRQELRAEILLVKNPLITEEINIMKDQ